MIHPRPVSMGYLNWEQVMGHDVEIGTLVERLSLIGTGVRQSARRMLCDSFVASN
jgi:hypothetical protein